MAGAKKMPGWTRFMFYLSSDGINETPTHYVHSATIPSIHDLSIYFNISTYNKARPIYGRLTDSSA